MRRTLMLALAAGLFVVVPTSTARAQSSYGYDSLYYNLPSGATYWYSSGYQGAYTDPSTATFAGAQSAPFRVVAPYQQPPSTTFGRTDGLATALSQGMTATTTVRPGVTQPPAQPTTVRVQRRGLFGRLRGRR